MNINKLIEIKYKIIINNNLFKKNIIDENTYSRVNTKLLKILKTINTN